VLKGRNEKELRSNLVLLLVLVVLVIGSFACGGAFELNEGGEVMDDVVMNE
jgi:hypothetical protein